MTDNCFLCLEKAKCLMCPANVCKMKAHKKCIQKYKIKCGNQCPVCKSYLQKRYNTRNTKKMKKDEIVNDIKYYLKEIQNSETSIEKKEITKKILNILIENIWFVEDNLKFKLCVKHKLIEFYTHDNWYIASEYYYKIFNESIV